MANYNDTIGSYCLEGLSVQYGATCTSGAQCTRPCDDPQRSKKCSIAPKASYFVGHAANRVGVLRATCNSRFEPRHTTHQCTTTEDTAFTSYLEPTEALAGR